MYLTIIESLNLVKWAHNEKYNFHLQLFDTAMTLMAKFNKKYIYI